VFNFFNSKALLIVERNIVFFLFWLGVLIFCNLLINFNHLPVEYFIFLCAQTCSLQIVIVFSFLSYLYAPYFFFFLHSQARILS
jgi:hypothetical protein